MAVRSEVKYKSCRRDTRILTSKTVGEDKGPGLVAFLQATTAPKFPLADTWVPLQIPQSSTWGSYFKIYVPFGTNVYILYMNLLRNIKCYWP